MFLFLSCLCIVLRAFFLLGVFFVDHLFVMEVCQVIKVRT